MTSNIHSLAVISSMGLGLAALFQAAPAKALTYTTAPIPFATYGNSKPLVSSNGTSDQLTFQKFNVPNSTLNSIKLNFTGPTAGSNPGGVISGNFIFGQFGPPITNNSVISISNISTQVQLFFAGDSLNINGPTIATTPSSSSFIKTSVQPTETVNISGGSYLGSSTTTNQAALLALFNGSGTVTTSKFQSIWNSNVTCVRLLGTSCSTLVATAFDTQVGEQDDPSSPPSALVNGGNAWISVTYDYTLNPSAQIPGPLPIVGAGMAFGFSRKLRRRIQSSAS
jgi:hypothetical protein